MAVVLPPLREVIERHGLWSKKALGQHFIFDQNVTRRIAAAAGDLTGALVYEVGPGPGGLTRALLETAAAEVVAVERDERCLEALAELADAYPGRLRIVPGDALALDESMVLERPAVLIANLPYNVATPLLFKWLGMLTRFRSLTLMFQREVAQRIAATPGSKTYGRLSVMVQWRCQVIHRFNLSPRVFIPPPKVESTVITLTPLAEIDDVPAKSMTAVVAAAFQQRRKMLRAALRPLGVDIEAMLAIAGVDGRRRAEELTVSEFCSLARAYQAAR